MVRRLLKFLHERIAPLEDPRCIGEALKGSELGEFWKYRVGELPAHLPDRGRPAADPGGADRKPAGDLPLKGAPPALHWWPMPTQAMKQSLIRPLGGGRIFHVRKRMGPRIPGKTASGGSQPGASFLSRLKAAPDKGFWTIWDGECRGTIRCRKPARCGDHPGDESSLGVRLRRVRKKSLHPRARPRHQPGPPNHERQEVSLGRRPRSPRSAPRTEETVLRRFYRQGFVDTDGTVLYYTRDHLGSVRELTDAVQAIRARYDYDPYGRMTKLQGDRDSAFTFTGHFLALRRVP